MGELAKSLMAAIEKKRQARVKSNDETGKGTLKGFADVLKKRKQSLQDASNAQ